MENKYILDVCCGSKMFYFNKNHEKTIYMDIRELEDILNDGRKIVVKPDIVGDFRDIPFPAERFNMVVFDPPHLKRVGENSWLCKKYGKLDKDIWPQDLKLGFSECFRVLKPGGSLLFKWNEEQIKLADVLRCTDREPLLGNKKSKTHWIVFIK